MELGVSGKLGKQEFSLFPSVGAVGGASFGRNAILSVAFLRRFVI